MQYQFLGFRRVIAVVLTSAFILGCNKNEEITNAEAMTLKGSVGDGPVVGADVRLLDNRGQEIVIGTSDGSSGYTIVLPAGTRFPVTLEASGGTDLVTGLPLDFTLRTTWMDPTVDHVNLSPIATLATQIAACRNESTTADTLAVATDRLRDAWGDLLPESRVPDPFFAVLDEAVIADVLLANEALGEALRRAHAALHGTSSASTMDELLERIACDLADGALDASSGASRRTMATFRAASASVALELIAGELMVNGQDGMSLLDAAIGTVMPAANTNVGYVPIDHSVADRARANLAVLATVLDDPELLEFMLILGETPPAELRSVLAAALDAGAMTTFHGMAGRIALADDTELSVLRDAAGELATAQPPNLSLAASPETVAAGGTSLLSWASTNAQTCVASDGWTGERPVEGTFDTPPLDTSTTYTLSCVGLGGTTSASVTVAVDGAPAAPTVTLTANPSQVASGGSSTLTWSSTNANSCTAAGAWSGVKSLSGSESVGPLSANSTYTLTCTGNGGSVSASATVSVSAAPPPPAPTLTLSASPTAPAYGGSTTVSWSSTNASSCSASGSWSGVKSTSGSQSFANLTTDQSYTLTCTGAGGSVTRTAAVDVADAPPTLSFTANPTSVPYDGSTSLTWQATNATSCTASGDWSGARAISGSSTLTNLTSSKTYTLSCTGAGGIVNQTVTVSVGAAPAPTLSFSANPTSVAFNGSTTLSWSSSNATSCTASGSWTGTKSVSGSETRANLTSNQSYSLSCTGAGGSVTRTASVTVAAGSPTVTLTASPAWVNSGGSSTLTWSSTNATSCTASGGWSGSKATSGSQSTGALTQDANYTLTCTGSGGNAVSMTSVGVRTAQLSWTAPTQNTDGTTLTDLAGYKIYYGTAPGVHPNVITVDGANVLQRNIDLGPGTWYFAMTAFNTAGVESVKTGEVSKTVE